MSTSQLDDAKYISLTTFKRDGAGVTTPVWLAGSGGRYVVWTAADTWKVKRIRSNPRIEVVVSSIRGTIKSGATVFTGTARLLQGDEADVAIKAVRDKYGLMAKMTDIWYALSSKIRRKQRAPEIALELTVSGAG